MDLELFLGLKINPKEVQIHLLTPTNQPKGERGHPPTPPRGYPTPPVGGAAIGFSRSRGRGEVGGDGKVREREGEGEREIPLVSSSSSLLHLPSSMFSRVSYGFHEKIEMRG